MKEVKAYECSVCGKISTSKLYIENCEEKHVLVNEIETAVYDSFERYPNILEVRFADETTQTYERRM